MDQLYQLKPKALWQAFRKESLSYWLICFYLFLEYVRPQTIYPAIDVLPWAFVTIMATVALSFHEGNRFRVKNVENVLFVLFFLTMVFSSMLAYSPPDSFDKLSIYIAWILVYFLIINIVNTESRYFVFLVLYILWNFKMTQHGFRSWAERGFSYEDWGVSGTPGWFQNSGEFGIQLCIFIPLLLYFITALWKQWGNITRLILLLVALTAFGSVLATNSRGALLGVAGALTWMLLKSSKKIAAMAVILPIAAVAYYSIPQQTIERFEGAGDDYTSQSRLKRWTDGLDIMNDNPVLGIGYANWPRYYRENYPPAEGLEPWGLPHNIFVDAGAELGYTGLILFVLMIVFTFVNNYRTRKIALQLQDKVTYHLAHGLDAGMIGFLISGSFVSVLFYPYFWIGMAFTVALNNVVRLKMEQKKKSSQH